MVVRGMCEISGTDEYEGERLLLMKRERREGELSEEKRKEEGDDEQQKKKKTSNKRGKGFANYIFFARVGLAASLSSRIKIHLNTESVCLVPAIFAIASDLLLCHHCLLLLRTQGDVLSHSRIRS